MLCGHLENLDEGRATSGQQLQAHSSLDDPCRWPYDGGRLSVFFSIAVGLTVLGFLAAWAVLALWPSPRMMALRYVVFLAAILLASAPLSVLLTLALMPFWRWLEATRGIDSVGHSGPAEWCFVAGFLTSFVILSCVGIVVARRRAGDAAA